MIEMRKPTCFPRAHRGTQQLIDEYREIMNSLVRLEVLQLAEAVIPAPQRLVTA